MKNLKIFITESNINKYIDKLVSLFKRNILKDNDITKDDFEDLENGSYNLCNVPQDRKLADDFFKEIKSYNNFKIIETKLYKKIILTQSGKKDIFIQINFDDEDGEGYKKGDILSVDMSKEIKDKLI